MLTVRTRMDFSFLLYFINAFRIFLIVLFKGFKKNYIRGHTFPLSCWHFLSLSRSHFSQLRTSATLTSHLGLCLQAGGRDSDWKTVSGLWQRWGLGPLRPQRKNPKLAFAFSLEEFLEARKVDMAIGMYAELFSRHLLASAVINRT